MEREDAIEYLARKGKIHGSTDFSKEDEAKIEEVEKKGKIYGDPIAMVE